jgi:hypothetical protein
MKGDFSRNTFDPAQRYSSVRIQQGRVQLDADWNEQVDITRYRAEVGAADIIGGCGGPLHNAAFGLEINERGEIILSPGRYYVDGILCESEYPVPFLQQPDLPGVVLDPTAPTDDVSPRPGFYIVYLDVWQRHLTALEAPNLRETALGGADTATRTRTIWQVRSVFAGVAGENDSDVHCLSVINDGVTSPGTGKLRAQASLEDADPKPCIIPPSAGYRGLENQLYRVEIHQAGEATDMEGGASIDAADLNAVTDHATYKWSRDNGIVVSRIEKIDGAQVTVENMGRDEVLGFASGQWVEIVDEARELRGEPGVLARIESVDPGSRTVTLYTTPSWPGDVPTGADDIPGGLKLRRWDGVGAVKTNASVEDPAWIEVEGGVEVAFDAGTYHTGEYWVIPARTATAEEQSGNVEWPVDDDADPIPQPPLGITHHYCKLAVVKWEGETIELIQDCRALFPPVTEITTLVYLGGDGQEAMPGDPLAQPLQVGVFNGRWPVEGATVRFTAGGGKLSANIGGEEINEEIITVPTDADGIASVGWLLDSDWDHHSQQVEARLLDAASEPLPPMVCFTANLSIASQVAYNPGRCATLAGRKTVQDALVRVVDLVRVYPIGGQGQEAMPGEELQPLRVLVTSTCGPIAELRNAVQFKVVTGGGTLNGVTGRGTLTGRRNKIKIETDKNGIAEVIWTLDNRTHYQEVEATLLHGPAAEPSTVRFGATLSRASQVAYDPSRECHSLANATTVQEALDQLCRVGPGGDRGIRIRDIQVGGERLGNDSEVAVSLLANGITVNCDMAPDPASIENKPVVDVTLDLPWPVRGRKSDYLWDESAAVLGFRSLRLNGQAGARDKQILWRPTEETADWLQRVLFGYMEEMRLGERVLARLTLKGNFIWARDSPDIYLDGEAFGAPDDGRTALRLDEGSGDGRRGGDFEMWFWLTRSAVAEPRLVAKTQTGYDWIVGQVTDSSGGPIPGANLTLVGTQFGAVTNAGGLFQLTNVPARTYDLRATFVGFTSTTVSVTVSGTEREPAVPELEPRAFGVRLEDVAGIGPRRSQLLRETGVRHPLELLFMTPDQLAERAGVTTAVARTMITSVTRLFK